MGEYLSDVIPGFLNSIHKVLIYDPVTVSFIAGNVIYKLFEWGNSFKNTRRKTALPYGKEMNCRACKDKEPSSLDHQSLHFENVQTNVASYSGAMTGSLKKSLLGNLASRGNLHKMTTKTPKSTARSVKTEEMTSSKHFTTIVDDDSDPKLYKMKITDEHQHIISKQYKQLLKQLSTPMPTDSNSWECQERKSGEMKYVPERDHLTQPTSMKWPVRNVSKLRMHFLRKILENLMMTFPEIVKRSMIIYNESCQMPSKQNCYSVSTEPSMDKNGLKHTPKFKSGIPIPNVKPIFLHLDYDSSDSSMVNDQIPRLHKTIETMGYDTDSLIRKVPSPIGHKKYCKKLASSTKFKRSRIYSKKETDLPIATILHLGTKIIQAASLKVCIDKSPEQMRNSSTPNYKRQYHFLQPRVMEDVILARSKLQTAKTKNKTEMIEKRENNGTTDPKSQIPLQVTTHVYSNPLQNPHVFSYSSINDQNIPSTTVRQVPYPCSDGNNLTRLPQHTDISKTSTSKLVDVFRSFKRFLVETMEPSYPQRRLRTGRATGNKLCLLCPR